METIVRFDSKANFVGYNTNDYNPLIEFVDEPVKLFDKFYDLIMNEDGTARFISKFLSYTDYDFEAKQFIRHVYAWKVTKGQLTIKEVRRDFEKEPSVTRNLYYNDYGCAKGTQVVWRKKRSYYLGELTPTNEWEYLNQNYYHKMAYDTYEVNINENIIKCDLSLQYFGWDPASKISMVDYIKMYREKPIVETIMKLKLFRFFENRKSADILTENKKFRKWIYANVDKCRGMAFQTVYNSFKKNPNTNPQDYFNSLKFRIECGRELATQFHSSRSRIYQLVMAHTTQERLWEYLHENSISSSSYFDYAVACEWLKLNFDDTKVLFPKNFNEVHNLYIDQWREYKEEERRIQTANALAKDKAEAEASGMNSKILAVANKYIDLEYANEDYVVLIAKSKNELIDEGSALNHCVGKMNYDQRIANESSLIFFVRKVETPFAPFVTVELALIRLQIAQMHAMRNAMPDMETRTFLENEWLPYAKEKIKEIRKEKTNEA